MAWSVLQSASNTSSATTVAATYGSNVSSGSKLTALVTSDAGGAITYTVKDGAGNTMTQVAFGEISGNVHVGLYAMDTPAGDVGTTPTLTATATTSGDMSLLIQEISGLAAGNTLAAMIDGTAGVTTGTTTSGSTTNPTYSSAVSGEYLVCAFGDDGFSATQTGPSGYTADPNCVTGAGSNHVWICYKNSTGGTEAGQYGISASGGYGWAVILVAFQLAAAAGGVSYVPPRVATTAPPSWAPWSQRDRRDANTVAAAANPLVSPLDTAWQADARYWHLYGDTAARDRRVYFAQRPLVSDPNLLATVNADPLALNPEQSPSSDLWRVAAVPAFYDRRLMPQQRTYYGAPGTAELENELLGGGDTARHALSAYYDRREVPQQRNYVSDPLLLATAELENELLGGAGTSRYYLTAAYWDRRLVPQERPYISDPNLLATALLENELLGGGDTARHWLPAAFTDRRLVPQQRAYLGADLTTAELENELLGGADTARHYLTAAYYDRREVPQQRPYVSDPLLLTTAELENELLGGADTARHYAWFTDRREVPQQRAYVSDPLLLATALLENELLGGAGTALRYLMPAYYDRREVPQQRAYVSDPSFYPVPNPPGITLSAWLPWWLAHNMPATHCDRREYPQQRPYVSDPSFYPTVAATVVFAFGAPYLQWATGTPYLQWATGTPYLS